LWHGYNVKTSKVNVLNQHAMNQFCCQEGVARHALEIFTVSLYFIFL
jgi:hypothetical protein